MIKKLILVVALTALVLGVLFIFVGCDSGVPVRIDAEDNGNTITLKSGQTLVLTLESNPTTGYSWELGEFDGAVLKLTSSVYLPYEQSSGKVGGGGEETWYFEAQSSGGTTLHLEYLRPWEKETEPARTFTVQVTVQPPSVSLCFWERCRPSPEPVVVINYQRSGGFAGVDERWLIYDNGLIEGRDLTTGDRGRAWTGRVEAQAVADLLVLIEKEGFFSFEERYGPLNACCDRFSYRIVVFAEGKGKVVMTIDGADAPEGLGRIMGEINTLISNIERP